MKKVYFWRYFEKKIGAEFKIIEEFKTKRQNFNFLKKKFAPNLKILKLLKNLKQNVKILIF